MLLRWKQVTKHDRALIRQIYQRSTMVRTGENFFGFHDMWILEFALGLSQGDALCFKQWMTFPVSWMTAIRTHPALHTDPANNGWLSQLSITACLTTTDKQSIGTLCWIPKFVLECVLPPRLAVSISLESSADSERIEVETSPTPTDNKCTSSSSSASNRRLRLP